MRSFNKYTINHVTRWFARLPRGPFAVVRHVGRRTGRPYETPIMVERSGDRFVIALTYGPDVDWYRNVLAAGHATLLWHGQVYQLDKPDPLPAQSALPLYSSFERMTLQRRGTQHFVSMKYRQGAKL
ncbi:MAG: nitroreductase family deazaflavin-dependent oxidoreductase [Chloroflexi bacterium]|nr:nitroreductase family deazaflavin-dependent oxidoreductase [Chloroflexota bacterium]